MAAIVLNPNYQFTVPDDEERKQVLKDFMDYADPDNAGSNYVARGEMYLKLHGTIATLRNWRDFERDRASNAARAEVDALPDSDYWTES